MDEQAKRRKSVANRAERLLVVSHIICTSGVRTHTVFDVGTARSAIWRCALRRNNVRRLHLGVSNKPALTFTPIAQFCSTFPLAIVLSHMQIMLSKLNASCLLFQGSAPPDIALHSSLIAESPAVAHVYLPSSTWICAIDLKPNAYSPLFSHRTWPFTHPNRRTLSFTRRYFAQHDLQEVRPLHIALRATSHRPNKTCRKSSDRTLLPIATTLECIRAIKPVSDSPDAYNLSTSSALHRTLQAGETQ